MNTLGKINIILMAAIIVSSLSACGKTAGEDGSDIFGVYGDTVAGLEGQKYYAVVETNAENPVLLVTNSCYDDEKGNQVSMDATVYYEVDGVVKNIGMVNSLGTAYPIAYDKTGIYAGGGHGMQRYEIDEAGGLTLAEGAYVTYDEDGNASFAIEDYGSVTVSSEEEYQKIWDKYESATVVNFTSSAK